MKAIDELIPAIEAVLPGSLIEQLKVKFPADDDGLWFITHPAADVEINLESSTGEFPFLIENSRNSTRVTTFDAEETVAVVRRIMARFMSVDYLKCMADAGRREDFDKYMATVPDVPPLPDDDMNFGD